MNCKPGDLAVIVRSMAGNEGKIVRCVRLADSSEAKEAGFDMRPEVWVLEKPLMTRLGFPASLCYDAHLRPIRDPGDDAVDESTAWLPPVPLPAIDPTLLPERADA